MKNDKGMPKSNEKSSSTGKKSKSGVVETKSNPTASETAKARSGRGLANEGTVVSYEEER
ncbi:MAG: hypothetical protein ABIQ31_07205 [Ferruginibacter sp.]